MIAGSVFAVLGSLALPAQSTSNYYGYGAAAARLLAAHNRERARVGVTPLRWDPQLAASAASYGPTLVRIGTLRHSPRVDRQGQRENLWMGTRGAFSAETADCPRSFIAAFSPPKLNQRSTLCKSA